MVPLIVGFSVNGWNVYRALTQEGLSPVVIDNERDSVFHKCRGLDLRLVDHLSGPPLLEALRQVAADGRSYLLISATEDVIAFLNHERDRIPRNIRVQFPSRETLETLLDKKLFYRAAIQARCTIQPMFFFASPHWTVEGGTGQIEFPCILKTRAKMYLPGLAKAYRIHNTAELQQTVEQISAIPGLTPDHLLLQQWVPGGDGDVFFCMQYFNEAGGLEVSFVGKKIRQWRPHVGGTASAMPAQSEEVLEESTRFFQAVQMRGLCSMEFKRSPTDGRFYMIEPTACRADYQEGVAIANGYNLPYAMYCAVNGKPYQPRPVPRPVLWVDMGPDYLSALHYRSTGELSLRQWMASLRGPKAFAVFTIREPGPFLETYRRLFAGKLRKLLQWNR